MKHLHAIVKATDAHTAMLAAVQDAAEQLRAQQESERAQRIADTQTQPPTAQIDYGHSGQAADSDA